MDESSNTSGAMGSGAGAGAGENGGDASNRFSRAKEFAGDQARAASDAVRDGYKNVRQKVDDVDFGALAEQARTYVRSNPGKALLISVGVGFLVGLLLRRDEDED